MIEEMLLAALTFVVALAWRDFFKDFLDTIIPQEKVRNKLFSELIYAICATGIVIVIFYIIS